MGDMLWGSMKHGLVLRVLYYVDQTLFLVGRWLWGNHKP